MSGRAVAATFPTAIGFGAAPIKAEGTTVVVDPGAPPRRRKPGEKREVGNDWMELPIPKNASRKLVHAMVDRWLDERARGFKGSM